MRTSLAVLSLAALCAAVPARGDDHIVTLGQAQQRLLEAEAARQQDTAVVRDVLARPEALAAAALAGADLDQVQAAVATLSDGELRDLALRAMALQTDPVAGLDSDIRLLLMIFLIVAIVILVLQAVD
jgi:hypothetical protein